MFQKRTEAYQASCLLVPREASADWHECFVGQPQNRNAAMRPRLLHAMQWSALVDDLRTFLLSASAVPPFTNSLRSILQISSSNKRNLTICHH